MAKVTLSGPFVQTGTDRTLYVTWEFADKYKKNTEKYEVIWGYATGDGVRYPGTTATVESGQPKNSVYTPPENATKACAEVKAVPKKVKKKGKNVDAFTAEYCTRLWYVFPDNPNLTLSSAPSASITNETLTVTITGVPDDANKVQIEVFKNDTKSVHKEKYDITTTRTVTASISVAAGGIYKVRARAFKNSNHGEWTDFTSNIATRPADLAGITEIKSLSPTSVRLDWEGIWKNASDANLYRIQWTTEKRYFGSSNEVQETTVNAIDNNTSVADDNRISHAEITGLESGEEYFFRLRAENDAGASAWTDIVSIIIGKAPSPPTTWSSTTTAVVGEDIILYWVHNSEDNSTQTKYEIELVFDDGTVSKMSDSTTVPDGESEKTYWIQIDSTAYKQGTTIKWRVRTAGILVDSNNLPVYSDWSIQRTINVYSKPVPELEMKDVNGDDVETLISFPFTVICTVDAGTQKPIGYHVSIIAETGYDVTDQIGNTYKITDGSAVYSKYINTSGDLNLTVGPSDVDLKNNIDYTLKVVVSMDSGLTGEASIDLTVGWEDEVYEPDAYVDVDPDSLTAHIMPYCQDDNGNDVEGVTLSVYRREYDGSFVKIGPDVASGSSSWLTDLHPGLDYARYRVVAMSDTTGAISYIDKPGEPVDEHSVVILWDEQWEIYEGSGEEEPADPLFSGSMIKIPYNIDISDDHKPDVALVEYIGRKHPVSYYGTQVGSTSSWNMEIPKDDTDTLYALRRLAVWMGDVYVREPSGSGYWANITVSFSQTHCEVTIPVSFSVTRVEGGA